jgi:hypothetical protein
MIFQQQKSLKKKEFKITFNDYLCLERSAVRLEQRVSENKKITINDHYCTENTAFKRGAFV